MSNDILPYFTQNAKQLLEKYDAENVLCRALALITGYTQKML